MKIKNTELILFFICVTFLCIANENDHLVYLEKCKEKAQKYVSDIIEAEKQPALFKQLLRNILIS